MSDTDKYMLVEKFNRIAGGFSKEELQDIINLERLEFQVRSRWFDATGKEDDDFTDQVAANLWKKLEQGREEKVMHSEITKE